MIRPNVEPPGALASNREENVAKASILWCRICGRCAQGSRWGHEASKLICERWPLRSAVFWREPPLQFTFDEDVQVPHQYMTSRSCFACDEDGRVRCHLSWYQSTQVCACLHPMRMWQPLSSFTRMSRSMRVCQPCSALVRMPLSTFT